MIPMRVADQDVSVERPRFGLDQRLTETMGARTAIEHDERPARRSNLHTRRVAAIARGERTGLGNGPAGSPEANEHETGTSTPSRLYSFTIPALSRFPGWSANCC